MALTHRPPESNKGQIQPSLIQIIMEMQNSLGKLEQATNGLADQVKALGEKIDKISHKVSLAQGAVYVVGGIATVILLLCKAWDIVAPMIQIKAHP